MSAHYFNECIKAAAVADACQQMLEDLQMRGLDSPEVVAVVRTMRNAKRRWSEEAGNLYAQSEGAATKREP